MTPSFREVLRARRFLNGAHRGASAYAPENTLPAFELAVTQGAAILEIDVRLTRDEAVVVIHDARVDRTTDGRGEVQRMTLSETQSLDAGGWFGEGWRGVRIPTLRQVLEQFAGRVLIDIDLKGGTEVRRLTAGHAPDRVVVEDAAVSTLLARKTVEVAERIGALDRVVLSGFGSRSLAWIRSSARGPDPVGGGVHRHQRGCRARGGRGLRRHLPADVRGHAGERRCRAPAGLPSSFTRPTRSTP